MREELPVGLRSLEAGPEKESGRRARDEGDGVLDRKPPAPAPPSLPLPTGVLDPEASSDGTGEEAVGVAGWSSSMRMNGSGGGEGG